MEERNEIIVKLKEELQDLRTNSSIKTKYLQKEARARGQSTNRIWAQQTSGERSAQPPRRAGREVAHQAVPSCRHARVVVPSPRITWC